MLSLMTYLPLAGAVLILLAPKNNDIIRGIALVTTFANFIVSLIITIGFDRSLTGYQFTEKADWIPGLGATYHMGVDGVSVLMLLLDGILFFLAIIASWKPIQTRIREYYFSMLLLNVGLVGVFCALDFFLFYIFWELVLIPMAVLIGVWGGPRRIYAAVKFFLYTLVGSLLMLVAIIALYFEYIKVTGKAATLDIVEITDGLAKAGGLNHDFQFWAFLAFGVAFCIKIPMWPLHTWLPDAHTEAPTAGSVILAGVMLKMGGYGLIRFNLSLFPNASHDLAPFMIVLALIAIIYGALVALVQPDMKRLVAYSSVSHMGFVVLGLFSFAAGFGEKAIKGEVNPLINNRQGFDGAVFTMFSHGLLTSGLFLCVGVIYDRLHTRDINTISNTLRIGNRMPVYATIMMVYTMGSLGLPMLSGFVGEFLSMQGAFRVTGWYAFTASFVIVFAAVYMLWLYKRVLFGRVDDYDLAFVEGKIKEAEEYERSHGGHASHNAEHSHEEHSHAEHAHEEHGHGHGHADKDMLRNGAKLKDLNFAEWFTLYPMAAFSIVTGVFPVLVLDFLGKPAEAITNVASKSVDIAGSIDFAAIVHLFSK